MASRKSRKDQVEQGFWELCRTYASSKLDFSSPDLVALGIERIGFFYVVFLIECFVSKDFPIATIAELDACLRSPKRPDDKELVAAMVVSFMQDEGGILKVVHGVGNDNNPPWRELGGVRQRKLRSLYRHITVCFAKNTMHHERIAQRARHYLAAIS